MSKVDGGRGGGGLKKLLRTFIFEAEILKIHFLRKFSSYQVCDLFEFLQGRRHFKQGDIQGCLERMLI